MCKIKDIIHFLESIAPLSYQAAYDNAGLLVGAAEQPLTKVLVTLDCTEAVVEEAKAMGCNLIIAHHPVIFKGLKQLTGQDDAQRCIAKAIKSDIALYAVHTNLDHVAKGVSHGLGKILGLEQMRVLSPQKGLLKKLITYVPEEAMSAVLAALHEVGAGQVGNYQDCAFVGDGLGQFKPGPGTNPHIGQVAVLEKVPEKRLELLYPAHLEATLVAALKAAHPYEEVAYYLLPVDNAHQEVGAGVVGNLPVPLTEVDFLGLLKEKLSLKMVKHTALLGKKVKRIALCGGAGRPLLSKAQQAGADFFVSSDFKYHDFFEADGKIVVADVGHYESEVHTKALLAEVLREKFPNIAVASTRINTNPVVCYT